MMSMRTNIPWEAPRPGRFTIDEWKIDLPRTALIIVDVQQGYADPLLGVGPTLRSRFPETCRYYDSCLGEKVLPSVAKLLALSRRCNLPTIYTRMGLQLPSGRDLAPWSWQQAQARSSGTNLFPSDSPAYQITDEIAPRPHDLVLDKNTASPFVSAALDQFLRNMNVQNLLIAGLLTNVAVESAARGAGDRGYNPIVVSDACAAYSLIEHEDTLATASWWTAKDVDEVAEIFGALPPGGESTSQPPA